jgi:anti-anti-sigma regulatory factor
MMSDLPFIIDKRADRVVITINSDAGDHDGLLTEKSYSWIQSITGTVELDFSQISLINSMLVAWLFHLIQTGRLSNLTILNAKPFVVKQLKQFYLDRFVTITYG